MAYSDDDDRQGTTERLDQIAARLFPRVEVPRIDTEAIRKTLEERAGYAWSMFEALKLQLEAFQERLSPTEEVGALLAKFGASTQITVLKLAYR